MGEPRDPSSKVVIVYKMFPDKIKMGLQSNAQCVVVRVHPPTHASRGARAGVQSLMILLQVHLQKPCYDFYFLEMTKFAQVFGIRMLLPTHRRQSQGLTKPFNR